ncbi:DUF4315 family protein [Ruminococcaceae bacterium OttesenSCG-928-L11]|nr:DUF4315 family protein [Ruminococcaceae bacterium OttesenSCG-928-L11]
MTPKIQKISAEIDKTRTRLDELRERLRDLERQKTDLENIEIVALFRSLEVAPDKLPDFIASMQRSASLPQAVSTPMDTGGSGAYTSVFTRREEGDDEE